MLCQSGGGMSGDVFDRIHVTETDVRNLGRELASIPDGSVEEERVIREFHAAVDAVRRAQIESEARLTNAGGGISNIKPHFRTSFASLRPRVFAVLTSIADLCSGKSTEKLTKTQLEGLCSHLRARFDEDEKHHSHYRREAA
jgi:hypothetical protein